MGYCKNHHTYHDGYNCPICTKNKLLIIIPVVIVGITLTGIFGYSSYENQVNALIDGIKLEFESLTKENTEIQNRNEEHDTKKEWENLMSRNENTITNTKPKIDELKLEKQIHELINQYRIKYNLSELVWDVRLVEIARDHSEDMAKRNFINHNNPDGFDPTKRATQKNYICEKSTHIGIGENIHQDNLYEKVWNVNGIPTKYDWNTQEGIAKKTTDAWKKSKGHRQNILDGRYSNEGIGITIKDEKIYVTQNFC